MDFSNCAMFLGILSVQQKLRVAVNIQKLWHLFLIALLSGFQICCGFHVHVVTMREHRMRSCKRCLLACIGEVGPEDEVETSWQNGGTIDRVQVGSRNGTIRVRKRTCCQHTKAAEAIQGPVQLFVMNTAHYSGVHILEKQCVSSSKQALQLSQCFRSKHKKPNGTTKIFYYLYDFFE